MTHRPSSTIPATRCTRARLAALTIALACLGAGASQAAITAAYAVNASSTFFDNTIANNLLTVGQSSLSGVTAPAPTGFSIAGLNDNTAALDGTGTTFYQGSPGTPALPATITFALTAGYDITSIGSIAGWGTSSTDGAYFGSQQFELLLKIGSSTTYTSYGFYGFSAFTGTDPVNGNTFSTKATLTNTGGGPIATNVTGIRLVYSDPYPTTPIPNHGTVIREISAFGTPTVPEPAACGLAGVAALGLLVRRRRTASI